MAEPDASKSAAPAERPATPPASGPAPQRNHWPSAALVLALIALAVAGAAYWQTENRLREMEQDLARRISTFDVTNKEANTAARNAEASLKDLGARLTALEAKVQDAQSQQSALASMYKDLTNSQDERVTEDVEQTLLLAQQQLQLAGNLRTALAALESAEAHLSRLNRPEFTVLQEAIAKDIARLKLLPVADITTLNAQLDALIRNVDQLKLESEPEPRHPPEAASRTTAPPTGGRWRQLLEEAWGEVKQLVRIQRLDHPDLPPLSPSQAWFLRENLKLRLLSARLDALDRDQPAFRDDIKAATVWVERYFNRSDPLTKSVLDSLKELAALPVAVPQTDIDASLKALRTLRDRQGG
jgi:uroporphyrin-3 C-methyltransferase